MALVLILSCTVIYAQTAVESEDPATTPQAATAPAESTPSSEILRYTINWPSGLSLGEGSFSSGKADGGQKLTFKFQLEAAVPGFPVLETVSSSASPEYCSIEYEKNAERGKKKIAEKTVFDQKNFTATRTTINGGKSELSTSPCAKDALTFLHFVRRELAAGRLPAVQKIYYGAPYDMRVDYAGAQNIRVADEMVEADRLVGTVKGPASQHTIEMYFARDPARTPLLIRVPLPLGKFSMELVR